MSPSTVSAFSAPGHKSIEIIVGEMSITRPNGEKLTIHNDGSLSIDFVSMDICDRCEEKKPLKGGKSYADEHGDFILWMCATCIPPR